MEYKGHPGVEELSSLLRGESPRCAVIVAAAFFDERLKSLLADTTDSSFSARIKAALEWGLLTRNEHDDLDLLRQLRNGFAHDLRVKDFDVTSEARVEAMRTWQVASDARSCRLQAEWAPLWETSGYHLSGCGADCSTTLGIKPVRRLDSRPLRVCRADQGRIDSLSGPGPMFR